MVPSALLVPITPTAPALSSAEQTQTASKTLPVSKQVEIEAKADWLPIDTTVQKGEDLQIIYLSGEWSAQPGADMPPYNPGSGGIYIPQAGSNALVAKIGDYSTPFLVGLNDQFQAITSGTLYLSINDYYVGNNPGSIIVLVEIWGRGNWITINEILGRRWYSDWESAQLFVVQTGLLIG